MYTKKNILTKIFVVFFIVSTLLMNVNIKVWAAPPKEPAADGAVLMDAVTGEILYQKNMNTPYPPASTTKIMTALLTLENCSLDEEVTISKNVENFDRDFDGTKIYLYKDEKLKVRDLLKGLMMVSANDCAFALAEHIGGSVENFAEMMNKRAAELGCKNTNFVNPHGLYDDKHRTSAYDLALIMRELVKYPEYLEIASTIQSKIPPTNKCNKTRPLWNGNRLINGNAKPYYEYLEAAKTGYTTQSLHSYVASASKDNHRLILALIHDRQKHFYYDTIDLFEYGFENFELVKLYSKGEEITSYPIANTNSTLPLLADDDFYIVKEKNSNQIPLPNYGDIDTNKTYKKNEYVTDAEITYDNKKRTLKLVSGIDYSPKKRILSVSTAPKSDKVDPKNAVSDTKTTNNKLTSEPGKIPFILTIVLIILLLILVRIRQVKIMRKRRKLRNSKFKDMSNSK